MQKSTSAVNSNSHPTHPLFHLCCASGAPLHFQRLEPAMCTCHHCFGVSKSCSQPYHELPMCIMRLWVLVQFGVGSHLFPIEQGQLVTPSLPCHLYQYDLCSTRAIGNELHYIFDCPHFRSTRNQKSNPFQDAEGSCVCLMCICIMHMWHKDQICF